MTTIDLDGGPLDDVVQIAGPYSGDRQYARFIQYTPLSSSPDYVFVGEYVSQAAENRSRVCRIPVAGGSISGQSPDQDVVIGTGFVDASDGHRGVPTGQAVGRLLANPAQHATSTVAVVEAPAFDLNEFVDASGISGFTRASYMGFHHNPHTGETWMTHRNGSSDRDQMFWRRTVSGWAQVGNPLIRLMEGRCYASGQVMAFGPEGVIAVCVTESTSDPVFMRAVHVIMSDDNGASWRNVEGDTITLPATAFTSSTPLSQTDLTGTIASMTLDTLGNPMVAWSGQHADGVRGLWIARWTGTEWDRYRLITSETYTAGAFVRQGSVIGVIANDPTDSKLYVFVTSDNGASWVRHLLVDTSTNPVASVAVDRLAYAHHGRHRVMTGRSTTGGYAATDATVSTIFEFTLPAPAIAGLVNARNGTLTAVGGTLTAA